MERQVYLSCKAEGPEPVTWSQLVRKFGTGSGFDLLYIRRNEEGQSPETGQRKIPDPALHKAWSECDQHVPFPAHLSLRILTSTCHSNMDLVQKEVSKSGVAQGNHVIKEKAVPSETVIEQTKEISSFG
ncbi:hypothetical protein CB1_002237004 [Camelus ferus]|nr:hypothetical protein CB1_002237004 [Camelus ferus]